jgi:CheY-like chemotaxis protein
MATKRLAQRPIQGDVQGEGDEQVFEKFGHADTYGQLPINQKIVEKFSESHSRTVLLVDDDIDTRLLTKMFLNNFGYEVDSADSASEALARFNPKLHDVVITDNSMAGMTGGEMAYIIKMRSPSTPVLMCTGNPPSDCSSIDVIIKKPTHLLAVKDAVDKLFSDK